MVMFPSLVQWITQEGGYVHPELELRGTGSERGIFAKSPICCDETLIRLPIHLAIHNPKDSSRRPTTTVPSSTTSQWLRCLVALYQARSDNPSFYKPYLDSLPSTQKYESLLEWTDEEISIYLAGTTVGQVIRDERQQNILQTRYISSVRPILEDYGLVNSKLNDSSKNHGSNRQQDSASSLEPELETFREACMCISTRAFHHHIVAENKSYSVTSSRNLVPISENNSTGNNNDKNNSISSGPVIGPFLLPLIDLINHDRQHRCTTLQCDGTCFTMIAERDVSGKEQIFHSYGDLCAGQFLQTFGFVPQDAVQQVVVLWESAGTTSTHSNWKSNDVDTDAAAAAAASINTASSPCCCLTPAILSKSYVIEACRQVATSDYPAKLRRYMKENGLEEDEVWDAAQIELDSRDVSFISDDILVAWTRYHDDNERNTSSSEVLSEELITLCALLLIPNDAYDAMGLSSSSSSSASEFSLLDRSVLEDFYLGMLVCRAILTAIERKRKTYTGISRMKMCDGTTIENSEEDDLAYLVALLGQQDSRILDEVSAERTRAMYGFTVRLEEKKCLQALESEVYDIVACLKSGYSLEDVDVVHQHGEALRRSDNEHEVSSNSEFDHAPTKRPRL